MFLKVSVILSTWGGLRRTPPDQGEPPQTRQTPPRTKENPPRPRRTPPGPRRTPQTRQTPSPGPRRTPRTKENPPQTKENPPGTKENPPPQTRQTPPPEEDCSIRSMSGRYASYWNAFLFSINDLIPFFHSTKKIKLYTF